MQLKLSPSVQRYCNSLCLSQLLSKPLRTIALIGLRFGVGPEINAAADVRGL